MITRYLMTISLSFWMVTSFAQLTTFEFDAAVEEVDIVLASTSAYLDNAGKTHIAWIGFENDEYSLNYSVFNGTEVTTSLVYEFAGSLIAAPSIVTDGNNFPHIAFFVKRNRDGGTASGNYAIYYASDPDGNGNFDVQQVSLNPEDPTSNDATLFDAYVNGRPQISINSQDVVSIIFNTDSNSLNGFDGDLVVATSNGSGFDLEKIISLADFNGQVAVDYGYTIAPIFDSYVEYIAYHSFTDDNLGIVYNNGSSWSIQEFTYSDRVEEVNISEDGNGKTYLMWFGDADIDSDNSGDDKAYYMDVTNGTTSAPDYLLFDYGQGGNLFYSTADRINDDLYFYYDREFNSNNYLIYWNGTEKIEYEIANTGNIYGKRGLHARNGFVSIVTASEGSSKIYITYGQVGKAVAEPLEVNFSANTTTIFEGEQVTFTDFSSGEPNSWNWTFEGADVTSSTEQNPVVDYSTAGTYDVTLEISNGTETISETKTDYLTVLPPSNLNADFSASSTVITAGDSVTFTDLSSGSPVSWNWSFEEGNPAASSEQNPVVYYSLPGTYEVSLTVNDGVSSDKESKSAFITVNPISDSKLLNLVAEIPYTDKITSAVIKDSYFIGVTSTNPYYLEVWDISNLDNPSQVDRIEVNRFLEPNNLMLVGNTLYVDGAGNSDNTTTLDVYDVSDPANPTLIQTYDTFSFNAKEFRIGNILDVNSQDMFASVGIFDLARLDVSDPANISIIGGYGDNFGTSIFSAIDKFQIVNESEGWLDRDDLLHFTINQDGSISRAQNINNVTGELYDFVVTSDEESGFSVNWSASDLRISTLDLTNINTVVETNIYSIYDSLSAGFNADLELYEEKDLLIAGSDVGKLAVIDVSSPNFPKVTQTLPGRNSFMKKFGSYLVTDEFLNNATLIYQVGIAQSSSVVADFTSDLTTVVAGTTVNFSDQSSGPVTGWEWTFDGGTPSTSTSQNPAVTYNTTGTY